MGPAPGTRTLLPAQTLGSPAKPVNPAESVDLTDPADTPAEGGDDAEEPGPDVMETTEGWTFTSEQEYVYHYLDGTTVKRAGEGVTGKNYQVLYLPTQTVEDKPSRRVSTVSRTAVGPPATPALMPPVIRISLLSSTSMENIRFPRPTATGCSTSKVA